MSQETPIGNLGGNMGGNMGGNSMNQEDSRLVDSILDDLNNSGQQQQQQQQQHQMPMEGGLPQEMTQEQHRAMLEHRQQQMMQQHMMQQHMMQQQQQQEQSSLSLIDKLQGQWKSILLVVVLSVVINMGYVDDLFKMNDNTFFIQENGALNIQATIIKAIVIGGVFFIVNNLIPM